MAEKKIKKPENKPKTTPKELDSETRLSVLENEVAELKKRFNINFGKGIVRDESKQVSLHDIDIYKE
jgi:hypothetical protein